ncbi:MAG: hypothetical protein BroJett013_12240 [Alphaproteobacteria bacterium]|nr:MAG: hypothetical protein BroJett013_12240 [Alphaproteobacteria bacterium]
MRRVLVVAALAGLFATIAPPAFAQTVRSDLPPAIASAGVTQAQWDAIRREVRTQARRARVSEAALMAAAEAAGANFARSGQFRTVSLQQTVFDALATQADQIADLQRRLDVLTTDADADVAAAFGEARAALTEGRLSDADRLLSEVAERDLVVLRQSDSEAAQRRLRAGETIAARGQVAFVQADFLPAARHYQRAADVVPQSASSQRAQYFARQAEALSLRGRLFAEQSNMREAIRILENSVLPIYESQREPASIFVTRLNLGSYQSILGELGDAASARAAIETLSALSPPSQSASESSVALWRAAQNNLGNALRAAPFVPNNLARAEQAYRLALTNSSATFDLWDTIADNLASTLAMQASAQGSSVPEEAFDLFQRVLAVRTVDCCAAARAQTLVNLAGAESINGDADSDLALLELSLRHYSEALSLLSPSTDPRYWGMAQRGVGLTLDAMGGLGQQNAYSRAAVAYQEALSTVRREASPLDWANLQTLRGSSLRRVGSRQALDESVQALSLALAALNRTENSEQWALAKYELGMAYLTYSDSGGTEGLAPAIAALQEAANVYSSSFLPFRWAQTHQNLGVSYERDAERSDPTRMPLAVESYRRALTVYTREANPRQWALAQANLGNALRIIGERGGNAASLRQAIEAYQSALEIYTQESTPREWGDAWNNLGSAYVALGDRRSLDLALAAYDRALQVRTREAFPDDWSSTQMNLSAAHVSRFEAGNARAINDAILASENALSTRSRSLDPASWARAKYNLAIVLGMYAERINRSRLRDAIAAAEDAVAGFRDADSRRMTTEASALLTDLRRLR